MGVPAEGVDKYKGAKATLVSDAHKLNVFISYSRRDSLAFSKQLAIALEVCGHQPVIDLQGISGGEEWRPRLREMILDSDTIVFVLSPNSAESPVCAWEVEEAARLNKRILPIIALPLNGARPHEQLRALNYIHFCENPNVPDAGFGHGLAKLDLALRSDLVWVREHRNILQRAEGWLARDRDPDRLLRGSLLHDAESWLASRPASAPDITSAMREYLSASRQSEDAEAEALRKQLEERERLVAENEAVQRREADAQAARELAQQEAVAQSKRVAQRTTIGLLVSMSLAFAAMWFGYQAIEQSGLAIQERDTALRSQSRLLTERGQSYLKSGDATTAMLLALEGMPEPAGGQSDSTSASRPLVTETTVLLDRAFRQMREQALLRYDGPVRKIVYDKEGKRIAVAGSGDHVRIWRVKDRHLLHKLPGHTQVINDVAFSADGNLVVSGSQDKTVRVWNADTGNSVAELKKHKSTIEKVFSSPDGNLVLSVARGEAFLWNVSDKKIQFDLSIPTSRPSQATLSQDGKLVVVGYESGLVRLIDVPGNVERQRHTLPGKITSTVISEDNLKIFMASEDKHARLLQLSDENQPVVELATGITVSRAKFDKSGKRLALARQWSEELQLWDLVKLRRTTKIRSAVDLSDFSFSPRGTVIAIGLSNGSINLHSTRSGNQFRSIAGHSVGFNQSASVDSVIFHPTQWALATGSQDNTVRLWSLADRPEVKRIYRSQKREQRLVAVRSSPNTKRWVGVTEKGVAQLFDSSSNKLVALLADAPAKLAYVEFTPNGSRIVGVGEDARFRAWDGMTGAPVQWANVNAKDISGLGISNTIDRMVITRKGGKAEVRDYSSGQLRLHFDTAQGRVLDVSFSPDGNRITTCHATGQLRIWNSLSGTKTNELALTNKKLTRCMLTELGPLLVKIEGEKKPALFDRTSGKLISKLQLGGPFLRHALFSQDGRRLVTVATDSNREPYAAGLWDAVNGRLLKVLHGEALSWLHALAFSPDSKLVATFQGANIYVWRTSDGVKVAQLSNTEIVGAHGERSLFSAVSFTNDSKFLILLAGNTASAYKTKVFHSIEEKVFAARAKAPRCLSQFQRNQFGLVLDPPRWCITGASQAQVNDPSKWKPLPPYTTDRWKKWLQNKATGKAKPLKFPKPWEWRVYAVER